MNILEIVKKFSTQKKRLRFVDLHGIAKNNVDIEKSVLMSDDFTGSMLHYAVS